MRTPENFETLVRFCGKIVMGTFFQKNPLIWVPIWENYPWTWVWVWSWRRHIPPQSKSEYPPGFTGQLWLYGGGGGGVKESVGVWGWCSIYFFLFPFFIFFISLLFLLPLSIFLSLLFPLFHLFISFSHSFASWFFLPFPIFSDQGPGVLVFEVGHYPRKEFHVIRIIFHCRCPIPTPLATPLHLNHTESMKQEKKIWPLPQKTKILRYCMRALTGLSRFSIIQLICGWIVVAGKALL